MSQTISQTFSTVNLVSATPPDSLLYSQLTFPVNHWCMNPCLRLYFWRMTKCNGHMHNTTRSQNMERKIKFLVKELFLGIDKNIIYVWNWKLTDWRTNFCNNFILLAIGVWISIFDRHNLRASFSSPLVRSCMARPLSWSFPSKATWLLNSWL